MPRFNVLRLTEDVADRKFIPILKAHVEPVVIRMLNYTINWLRDRRYPLRKGRLPESDADRSEWDGRTPTERLHPGSRPLWASMRHQLRKVYRQNALAITLVSSSEHAPYFFNRVKAHPIPGTEEKPLIFHAGAPLPWHPAFDGRKPGIRKLYYVSHPGHMDYGYLLREALDYYYGQDLDAAVGKAAEQGRDSLEE